MKKTQNAIDDPETMTARRWVELVDLTDTLNVLDETGLPACKIRRRDDGGLVFAFRDGQRVEVPLR